jgi:ribonuclease D
MTDSHSLSYQIITTADSLATAVREMAESDVIAMDTESNSRHHYPEQLCLIQVATRRGLYIIDTILLPDIQPLKAILEDVRIQKVIHGADYDIRCLDRHYDYRVNNLFDTSVAARFAGLTEFGLAALLKNQLGLNITKNERIQQSDWGRRPLSEEAWRYAAEDVQHLFKLREKLLEMLEPLGRVSWVDEECRRLEEVRFNVPDPQTAFFAIKGSRDLSAGGLAILRSLSIFREEEAIRQGRPPFFIIPDFTLVALAANPHSDLSKVAGLGTVGLRRFGSGLRQALEGGQNSPPVQRPVAVYERMNQAQSTRLNRLKEWRLNLGSELKLDPSLLWPAVSLERLARAPQNFNTEIDSSPVRNWQRKEFKSSLENYLQSISGRSPRSR